MIYNVKWEARGQDGLVWVEEDLQEYTINSGYSILNCEDLMRISETFHVLWSLKVAPSALVCAWRLLLDRLPTRSNLARRGVQLGSGKNMLKLLNIFLIPVEWQDRYGICVTGG